ncbi:MAG: PEGA domain-containing protein [Desulfobacterales bacterium]|jgi:hypothetical protein
MKQKSKTIIALTFGIVLLFASSTVWSAELIAPTRSLEGAIDEKATLSVSSEPPGLNVTLDGTVIGETPVIEKEIEPGSHVVRIGDSETQIYARTGKPIQLSWFKGTFIEMPIKKADSRQQLQPEVVEKKPKPQTEAPQKKTGKYDPAYWPTNPTGPIAPYIR